VRGLKRNPGGVKPTLEMIISTREDCLGREGEKKTPPKGGEDNTGVLKERG